MIKSNEDEKDFYKERVFRIAKTYKRETQNPGLRIFCTDKESCKSILSKTDDEWLNYCSIYIIYPLNKKEIKEILISNNKIELIRLGKIKKRHHEIFDNFWQGTALYLNKPAVFFIPKKRKVDRQLEPIISTKYLKKPNIILGKSDVPLNIYSMLCNELYRNKHEICIPCGEFPNNKDEEISVEENHYNLNEFKIVEDMVLKNAFPKPNKEDSNKFRHLPKEYLPVTNFHTFDNGEAWYEEEKSARNRIEFLPIYEGFYSTELDKYKEGLLKHGVIMLGGFNCGSDHIARYLLNELAKNIEETNLLQIKQLTCENAVNFVGNNCDPMKNFFGKAFILRNIFDPIIKVREFNQKEGMLYKHESKINTCYTDRTSLYKIAKNKIFDNNAIIKFFSKFNKSPKEMGNFLIITTQYDNLNDLEAAIHHHFHKYEDTEFSNNMISSLRETFLKSPTFYSLAKNEYYQQRIKIALVAMIKDFEQLSNKKMNIEWLLDKTEEGNTFTDYAKINGHFRPVLFYYMMSSLLYRYTYHNNVLEDFKKEIENICKSFQENAQKAYDELYRKINHPNKTHSGTHSGDPTDLKSFLDI